MKWDLCVSRDAFGKLGYIGSTRKVIHGPRDGPLFYKP